MTFAADPTSMPRISLLGCVRAHTADGAPIDLGPAKCQALLAALALAPGAVVPVSRLVEAVWGDDPPRTAEKTLQSYVTRLRKGLGAGSISRSGSAYRLDVSPEMVDVARFQAHITRGERDDALQLWVGTPLAGVEAPGLAPAIEGLVEQWLSLVEADLADRVESEPAEAIAPLTELTAGHPFREGLWALLMTALYRVGRQADALAAYRTARTHLVEHLGAEPGPRLRELESLVLGQDEALEGRPRPPSGIGDEVPTGTVTFAFSDVEGSSRLWSAHRAHMAASIARHDTLMHELARTHRGHIFATGGDSFGVAFHRASDGLAWAQDVQDTLTAERWPGELELRVRIGLHTGEAEERGGDFFGPAVNIAARIAAAGHGGQILLSGVTASLVDHRTPRRLTDLGVFRLDGVVSEHRIHQCGEEEFPPLRTEDGRRGNLPRRQARLIGRGDDLANVVGALDESPVVTLVGPGGIGKTRLAVAAARTVESESGGGAWLIELAGVGASADVPRAVAEALHVSERVGRTATESIVAVFERRRALLVLDNCEHVVDGAAAAAQAIVEQCPDVKILATSREGLGLEGEQLIVVSPLEPEGAAMELFIERATAADQAFDPEPYGAEIAEICLRLDGVPLAIELAAARTRSLTPRDLVGRLDDHLRLLTGGRRATVERHRTLRATIQWSYELLTPPEQTLFRRLSIFAGPFGLTAAETVALGELAADPLGDGERSPAGAVAAGAVDADLVDADLVDAEIDDLLAGLVERSMLIAESGPVGRRFRLLETMRQYGAEHLADVGLAELIAARHAQWCVAEVETIKAMLAGRSEIEGVVRLAELWPNLRAAVDWSCSVGDYRTGFALVGPVATEVFLRGQMEICDWFERLLAITPAEEAELIVLALAWAARRYQQTREVDRFWALTERFGEPDLPMMRYVRAFMEADNEAILEAAKIVVAELRGRDESLMADLFEIAGVGGGYLTLGRFDEHDRFVADLVEKHRRLGPPSCLNWALTMLGFSSRLQGHRLRARVYFDEAGALDVPPGTQSMSAVLEARAALEREEPSRAVELLWNYAGDLMETDNMSSVGFLGMEFVNTMVAVDRIDEAAEILRYVEVTVLQNYPHMRIMIEDSIGVIAHRTGGTGDSATRSVPGDRTALELMRRALHDAVTQESTTAL